jgi:hypothetical protein
VRKLVVSTALATVLAGAAPAQPPLELPVERVSVELRGREQVRAAITAPAWPAGVPRTFAAERLVLDTVEVPLAEPALLENAGGRTVVRVAADLAALPREVLGTAIGPVSLHWEGLDEAGEPLARVGGVVDVRDPQRVQMPSDLVAQRFVRLTPVAITPLGDTIGLRLLLTVYNPFSFDVLGTRLEYSLGVGGTKLVTGHRGGFRLRSGRWSDVLVEEEIPSAALTGSLLGVLRGEPLSIQGGLGLLTPQGERFLTIERQASR